MSSIDMWDSVADAWERNAGWVDEHMAPATNRMLALAQISAGDAVLDLASGPGGAGLQAAPLVGDGGSVVLSDAAPHMVEVAARRSEQLPNVSAALVDLDAIDLAGQSFDAALCRHGLMFVADPVATTAAVAAHLRPAGHFVAATWDLRENNPWLGLIFDSLSEQFGVPFPPPAVRGPFTLSDIDALKGTFEAAGLQDVSAEAVPVPMRTASLADWWARVPEVAGPVAQALAGMEPGVRDAIRGHSLASAESLARVTADGIELDGSILVVCGRRLAT